MLRELNERMADNLRVTLYWDDHDDTVTVAVEDFRSPGASTRLSASHRRMRSLPSSTRSRTRRAYRKRCWGDGAGERRGLPITRALEDVRESRWSPCA